MSEHDQLNHLLEQAGDLLSRANRAQMPTPDQPSPQFIHEAMKAFDLQQWAKLPNDMFGPIGPAEKTLPPAVYKLEKGPQGELYFRQMKIVTDDLLVLPDSANDRVLHSMRTFWKMAARYKDHGLIYKRGILLWGPPGSGKTATIQLLIRELISQDGLVIVSDFPGLTSYALAVLRRIEPERRLIVILEDVDETINRYGEHELLALLDGEQQVDNVVMIATTNYPERLGARIVNRPSRFDERILVDMPSAEARRVYLKKVAHSLDKDTLEKWVTDTDKLSVAHLRELTAAVLCLDQPYEDVLQRLRSMRIKPRDLDGFNIGRGTGFGEAAS